MKQHESLRRERLRLLEAHGEPFLQENVARRIGVTQGALSRWETGGTVNVSEMAFARWRLILTEMTREHRRRKPASAGKENHG